MTTTIRRIWGQLRTDLVRSRVFDRPVRTPSTDLTEASAHEQAVFAQACRNVEKMIPMNGGRV